jgi:hypothetical protein
MLLLQLIERKITSTSKEKQGKGLELSTVNIEFYTEASSTILSRNFSIGDLIVSDL